MVAIVKEKFEAVFKNPFKSISNLTKFDNAGRLITKTYADTENISYVYDNGSRLITMTDQNNNDTVFTYDNLNRLLTKTYGSSGTQTFEYDLAGRMTKATDNNEGNETVTSKYLFDKAGRMTSEAQEFNSTTWTTVKEFDKAGNMTKITHPDGRIVEYTYTGLHQPDEIKTDVVGTSAVDVVADYDWEYDSTGDADLRPILEAKTLDNCVSGGYKVTLDLEYDAMARITSYEWTQNTTTKVGFIYEYDLAGNLTKADHLHSFSDDEVFEYDACHRLTQYKKGASSTQDWYLDGVYNWTKFVDYGTTEERTHNSVNEVTAIDTNNDADFEYDKNGNLTQWEDDPDGTPVFKKFYWDGLNRLTKIKVGNNDEAIFIYDVNNQRVRKEYDSDDDGDIDTNDETIEYVWADGHVVEEYVDGSIDRNYVHGNMFIDELILFDDGTDVYYYLQDFRYSVYAIVDDTGGTPKTTYRYDPYGKRTVVSNPGSLDNSYGFTGRYHDDSDETDLVYFRNRWLSPEMGRFISRDPEEYIDGMNLYVGWFVPNLIDPFGLEEVTPYEAKGRDPMVSLINECECWCIYEPEKCKFIVKWEASLFPNDSLTKEVGYDKESLKPYYFRFIVPTTIELYHIEGKDVTGCHLQQDVFLWANYLLRPFNKKRHTIKADVSRAYQTIHHAINYGGYWYQDVPRRRKKYLEKPKFPQWLWFEAHVFVEEIPKVETWWGFTFTAWWEGKKGTYGFIRWRNKKLYPFSPLIGVDMEY